MVQRKILTSLAALPLLILLPLASSHGDDTHTDGSRGMGMSGATSTTAAVTNLTMNLTETLQPSYFSRSELSGLLIAHVTIMILAWFFILPVGKLYFSASQTNHQ